MNNYNEYVNAINKIFELISITKSKIKDIDNINYIDNIEVYKDAVVKEAQVIKDNHSVERL